MQAKLRLFLILPVSSAFELNGVGMSVVAKEDPELNRLAESMAQSTLGADSTNGLELTFSAALDDAENLEQLGPVIKQITETGRQEAFVDQLDALIRKKDGEIERMCNAHYQVNSTHHLYPIAST